MYLKMKEFGTKKLFAFLLVVITLIAAVFSLLVFRQKPSAFDGNGTEQNPYTISTKTDLKTLQTNVNNGTNYLGNFFVLGRDIDMEGDSFLGIGNSIVNNFAGNFNGRGYTISNLSVMKSDATQTAAYNGLFGYVNGATISNLVLRNIRVNVSAKSGDNGATGGANLDGKPGMDAATELYVGGVAGYALNSTITNCYVDGSISTLGGNGGSGGAAGARTTNGDGTHGGDGGSAKNIYVGGIAGYAVDTSFTYNGFSGGMIAIGGSGGSGGLGGNYRSTAATTGGSGGNAGNAGDAYVGGIVGYNTQNLTNSKIDKNYTSIELYVKSGAAGWGADAGTGRTIGGKGGDNALGGAIFSGGIAGLSNVSIENSFTEGNAEIQPEPKGMIGLGTSGSTTPGANGTNVAQNQQFVFGGIVGTMTGNNSFVKSSYSSMNATENHDFYFYNDMQIRLAGIVGYVNADNVTLQDCISLNKIFTSETTIYGSGTANKLIANFATYGTEDMQQNSINSSARNKYLDVFLYTPNVGDEPYFIYKNEDLNTIRVTQAELINQTQEVFEHYSSDVWEFSESVNEGFPTFKDAEFRRFNYTKRVDINNYNDLKTLANRNNSGYSYYGQNIYINADILMDPSIAWEPIGKDFKTSFQGSVYGQGYVVDKMSVVKAIDYKGLFGYTSKFKLIDLKMKDPVFSSNSGSYTGAFVGYNLYDATLQDLKVTQSGSNYGNNAVIKGNRVIGGVAGELAGLKNTVTGLSNTVNVVATNTPFIATETYAGGLIGAVGRVNFSNSYNVGNVTINASTTLHMYAGGLVGGSLSGKSVFKNSFNVGNISGGSRVAGLIGLVSIFGHETLIESCYATGEVNATYSNAAVVTYNSPLVALGYYNVTMQNTVNAITKLTVSTKHGTRYIGKFISFAAPHKLIHATAYYTRDTFKNLNNYYNTTGTFTAPASSNHAYYYDKVADSTAKTLIQITEKSFWENDVLLNFDEIWDYDPAINNGLPFLKGKGGELGFESQPGYGDNPIKIGSEQELITFRNEVNAGKTYVGQTIVLTNNINLNGQNWVPIGTTSKLYFSGTFDGNGFTIAGLMVDKTTVSSGLFGYAINATFKNLNILNPAIVEKAGNDTGALLGRGTTNIIIDNVHVSGGFVKSTADNIGGIVGIVGAGAQISNSSVINTEITGRTYVGGIVGYAQGTVALTSVSITNSFSAVHIKGTGNAIGGIAGGLAGGVIDKVYTTGSMFAMAGYTGGIVGVINSRASVISNAMARGDIYSHRASTVIAGGIAGNVAIATDFKNCFATGDIRAASNSTSTSHSATVGGIVGYGNVANVKINNSVVMSKNVLAYGPTLRYTGSHPIGAGLTSGRPSGGGVAGSATNIYLDEIKLGPLKALTEAQLSTVISEAKRESAFYDIGTYYSIGWDTNTIATNESAIWNIDENVNDGLPYITSLGEVVWAKGSVKNPHEIANKNDLVALANRVNGGDPVAGQYFDVVNSFEIGDWTTPIGTTFASSFSGIFNGNMHTLSGLRNPVATANGGYGLFGFVVQGQIKNVILSKVNINLTTATTKGDKVAPLVAQSTGTMVVENCAVVSGSVTSPALHIGGLIGFVQGDGVVVKNSYSAATVKGGAKVGGLIGTIYGGIITKSYATGNVTGSLASNYGVGGLIGSMLNIFTLVEDCYSKGNVSDNSTSTYAVAGGIAGHISGPVTFNRVYATGDIIATTSWASTSSGAGVYAGGIAGLSNKASSPVSINNSVSYSKKIMAINTNTKLHTAQSTPGVGCTTTSASYIATGSNSWYFEGVEFGVNKGVAGAAIANTYMSPKAFAFLSDQENLDKPIYEGGLDWNFEQNWSMKESVNGGFPYLLGLIPNRSDLEALIFTAAGYEREEWLDSLYDIFETALNNAIAIYENDSASFEALDQAYIALKTAIENLRGDTRELQTIYDTFLNNNIVIEYDEYGVSREILLSHLYKNWGLVESALSAAKLILDENSNAYNNSYINNSKNVLIAAISSLILDKTDLQKLISQATELKEENYDPAVWVVLVNVLAHAINVNNNEGMVATSKDVYYAINDLTDAMSGLKLDITYLQSLIAEAEGYIEDIPSSKFTSTSYNAYIQAIADAKLITAESDERDLNLAIFNLSVEITNLTADKSMLQTRIGIAEGKDRAQYTLESFADLETALSNAKDFNAQPRPLLANIRNYIAELDIVSTALKTALDNLVINTALLDEVIAQAKAEENDDHVYTQESWNVLQDAIIEAEAIVAAGVENLTGKELLDIIDKVKNAILNLEINKTYLIDLINSAELIKQGYYNATSYNNLKNAIAEGKIVRDNQEVNITEVRGAMTLIKQTIANLQIDKGIIENFINRMENLTHEDYIKPTDWSLESYEALLQLKIEAKELLDGEYDNEMLLQMINDIENALSNLVPDKKELDILINELSKWTNTKYRQDNDGNFILDENGNLKQFLVYSAGTWRNLQDAIAAARIIQHSNVATRADILQEIENLNNAVEALRVDVTEVQYKIYYANELLLQTTKYTAESLEALNTSKLNAEAALLIERLTLEELQLVLDDLVSKINNLVVDRSTIIELIDLANSLVEENYTPSSWTPFVYTRNYVNSIIDVPGLTAEDVINFYNSLESAMNALRPKKDKLVERVLYASSLPEIFMSTASYAELQAKIAAATVVINDPLATLNHVNTALDNLNAAITAIEIDRAELARLIVLAESKYTLNYTTESINSLKAVVTEAKAAYNDANSNIDDIVGAADLLKDAMEALRVNTAELENLLNAIYTQLETIIVDDKMASEFYTEESYEFLSVILNEAERALDNESITLEEYNAILNAVNAARAALVVNKDDLNSLINIANTINTSLYETNSANAFNAKLLAAKNIAQNSAATINQYLTALNELQTAMNNLVFDTSALDNLRAAAEAILDNAENYTQGSITDLERSYNNSFDFEPSEYASICVDLESKILAAVYIGDLKVKLTAAEIFIDENLSDYETGILQYYDIHFMRLLTAFNEASDLITNPYLTKEQVNDFMVELSFEVYMTYIGDLKQVYNIAILEDEALYSRTSFARLKDAIEDARLILLDETSNEEDIQSVTDAIIDALNRLEAIMFTNQLLELYNDVKDYSAQDYTIATFRDFSIYMLQAEAIINNPEASQSAAMEVLNLLQDAIANLISVKELRETVEEFSLIDGVGYTLNSYKNFTDALELAVTALLNENLTANEINTILTDLRAAKNALIVDQNKLQTLYNRVRNYKQEEFTPESDFANFTVQLSLAQSALQSGITGDILIALVGLNDAVLALKVNDHELQALIAFSKTIVETNYLFGYQEFVNKAAEIENSYLSLSYVSLETYKDFVAELKTYKDNLRFNDTMLVTLISQANVILETEENYSVGSINKLKAELLIAENFVPEQDDYELICSNLQTAIGNIVYLKELRDLLALAKQFESENMSDYLNGTLNYFEKGFAELMNAIVDADSSLRDINITKTKVNKLLSDLNYSENLISIIPLRDAINSALAIDKNKFTASSYAAITGAITNANTVTGNYNSTLEDVNDAILQINNAIHALVVKTTEGEALVTWFENLNALHYESGYSELENAINNLNNVINRITDGEHVTLQTYEIALNQAKARQAQLTHNSKQSLQNAIDSYYNVEYLYTPQSFAVFKVFLISAEQKILNNTPMLVSEIQAEINLLEQEAQNLVLKDDSNETIISVIEGNETFKFINKDGQEINKEEHVYDPDSSLYLTNIALYEKITTILSQFNNSNLKVFNMQGEEITNLANLLVATGQVIKLYNSENEVIDSITLIVKGDLNGDGEVDIFDIARLNQLILGAELNEMFRLAGDINGDNEIDIFDMARGNQSILGNDIYKDIRLGE